MSLSQPGNARKLLRWLPGVVISAIAIYAVIHFTEGQDFGTALRSVKPWFVVFLIALSVLTLLVRSIAWRTILGNRVALKTSLFGISEGYFRPGKLGALIPGSRKQKELSDADLEQVAAVYRQFKRQGQPEAVPGFYRVAVVEEVRDEHHYSLSPGRYVGSPDGNEYDIEFEERMPYLVAELKKQFSQSAELEAEIQANLREVGFDA